MRDPDASSPLPATGEPPGPPPQASATGPPAAAPTLASRLQQTIVAVRQDLVVTRQIVRGGPRYVVHDPVGFRNHILTAIEYRILCTLDARHTLGETFAEVVRQGLLASADAEEFYGFVLGLHNMRLLVVPGIPVEMVWRRHQEQRHARRRGPLRWLMSLRIPFGNPDPWLTRTVRYVHWLFTPVGVALWFALLAAAVWQCAPRLGELYGGAADLLALHNLPILWCSLVGLKALHELGHAFALKRYGGAVPDYGVIFVLLTPCAYVDANASWTFSSRWPRIVVGVGGMYVETLLAAIFALVWAGTPAGLLHDIAQNIVVLATVSTILINVNPLIKFDGYYLLSDLTGMVNLQERASRYLRSLAERVFLGMPLPDVNYSRLERSLIWAYAPAALLYRISLALGISFLMATTWPLIGAALGLAFGWMMVIEPLVRLWRYLWSGERTAAVRLRARFVAVAAVLLVGVAAARIPVSHTVTAPGVLDPGVRQLVRAPGSGFIAAIDVADGTSVKAGQLLCRLQDPRLAERQTSIEAELATVRIQFDATEVTNPTLAATLAARREFLEQRAAELQARAAALDVTVPMQGTVVGTATTAPGQFVHQGDELMQVHSQHQFVRVVLTDRELARARLEIGSEGELRWTSAPHEPVRAVVREIRRSASRHQVPVELTMAAGGTIYTRPIGQQAQADQPYLHVFLAADAVPLPTAGSGLTAAVRFAARQETLGGWVRRRLLTFFYNWSLG